MRGEVAGYRVSTSKAIDGNRFLDMRNLDDPYDGILMVLSRQEILDLANLLHIAAKEMEEEWKRGVTST